MQGVAQRNKVSIDITNHIRTFINPNNGEEVTREQLKSHNYIKAEGGEQNEDTEGTEGISVEKVN